MKIYFLLPLLGVILGPCSAGSAAPSYYVPCPEVFSEYERFIKISGMTVQEVSDQGIRGDITMREPLAKTCSQDSECAVPGMTRTCRPIILGGKTFGVKLCCAHARPVAQLFTWIIAVFTDVFSNPASTRTPGLLRHEIGRMLNDYEKIKGKIDFTALVNVAVQFQQLSKSVNERCPKIKCGKNCDFGYKMFKPDNTQPLCPGCDCEEDPCKNNPCKSDEKCHLIRLPPPEIQSYSLDPKMFWVFAECRKIVKPGSCPCGGMSFLDGGSCAMKCQSDDECRGHGKCCATMCGTKCVQPRGLEPNVPLKTPARAQTANSTNPPVTTTGPNNPNTGRENPMHPPKPCKKTWSPAGDCHEKLDYAIQELLKDINSMLFLPRCNWDGSWQKVQLNDASGISWCVNETDGKAVSKTEIRGVAQCDGRLEYVSCEKVVFPEYEKKILEEAIRRGQVQATTPISMIVLLVTDQNVQDAIKELEPHAKYCSQDSDCTVTGMTRTCKPIVLGGKTFGVSVCCPHARLKLVQQSPVDECQGKKCPITSCFMRPPCRAFPKAVCRANPCKSCALEFYMPGESKPVDCYKDIKTPTCLKQRDEANRDYLTKMHSIRRRLCIVSVNSDSA